MISRLLQNIQQLLGSGSSSDAASSASATALADSPDKQSPQRPNLSDTAPFPLYVTRGDQVEEELLKLRKQTQGKANGAEHVPVILGDRESTARVIEHINFMVDFDKESEAAKAEALSPEAWFAERRTREEEYNFSDDQNEVDPMGTRPMTRLTIGYNYSDKPHREVFIAMLPLSQNEKAPLALHYGGWNECPHAHVHVALARYWKERYGAEIATMASDIVEFTVTNPPATDEQAMELAWQHYLYCADIVEQGVGSVATLAQALRHSTRWYFWWD